MFRRNLWKIALTVALLIWALASILPLSNQPFDRYIQDHANWHHDQFVALVHEAQARVADHQASSTFVALKQIGKERKIDLTQYFPDIRLEESLRNIEQRNDILLNELLKRSKSPLQYGLDLRGGVSVMLQVDESAAKTSTAQDRQNQLQKAVEIIGARINGLGVTEPIIRPVGNNRIEIQLPGVSTKENPEIIDNVKKPARLDFRVVNPTVRPGPGVDTPPGYQLMSMDVPDRTGGGSQTDQLFVKRIPEMSGSAISEAFWRPDMYGKPEVILKLTSDGRKRFAEVTKQIADLGKENGTLGRLAIVLDGKLYSAPTVREEINSDSAEITGSFTEREAQELANVLNNPLDLPLIVKEQFEVGPSLAADSIASGKRATVIGVALVAAFMIGYYTLAGFIAVLSVSLNILIILAVLASLGATITMPGIAGIVLTVGMAVDAHILIFERMREEIKGGKSLWAAFQAGHEKAFSAIVDANITTLITSVLMIVFGTGPVKGFGVTLTIGIFSTLFTALVVSEMLLDFAISTGVMKRMIMGNFMHAKKFDYIGSARKAFGISSLIVLVGVVAVIVRGHNMYGVDFIGGDVVTLNYKQQVDTARIRTALEKAQVGEVNPIYQTQLGSDQQTLSLQTETGKGDLAVKVLEQDFPQAGFDVVGKSSIGPSVGKEVQWNAILAIVLSLIGIMIYVVFRFEMGYAIGAFVSTLHDVLMTVGIFALTDRQLSAPMVGAILLIVGYSVNDTIVVFDRIREELKVNPEMKLRDVINLAMERVLARTVMTSVTTFLAALALYVFAGGVLGDLSFTFLVGIVTGTFSSIFIASPIFYWWHKGDRKHVEAHADIAPKYEWTGSSKASQ